MLTERRLPKHRLEELRDECVDMIRYCVRFELGAWAEAWGKKLSWIARRIAVAAGE